MHNQPWLHILLLIFRTKHQEGYTGQFQGSRKQVQAHLSSITSPDVHKSCRSTQKHLKILLLSEMVKWRVPGPGIFIKNHSIVVTGYLLNPQTTWAVAFFPVSAGISEKLGSFGDFTQRNSPWRLRQLSKGKHLKIVLVLLWSQRDFHIPLLLWNSVSSHISGTQFLVAFL